MGRARELAALEAQLARGEARIAVYGPIGAGKTTLVRALVSRARWASRTLWCDLKVSAGGAPLATIAHALGLVGELEEKEEKDVVGALAAGQIEVIVLDGAQDHLAHCEAVRAWADRHPGLSLLVTSTVHLPTPPTWSVLHLGPLEAREGVDLYLHHGAAGDMLFELPADELDALRELVTELGGWPGAIVRLATGASMLPPSMWLGRLDTRLQWLDPGAGGQGSLRAEFEAALGRVGQEGARVLEECVVFVGGVGLGEAEAILSQGPTPVWPQLHLLWRHSLLGMRTEEGGAGVCFELDATLRAFLLERADPERLARAHRRHAKVMMQRLIPAAFEDLWFQGEAVGRLDTLASNLPVLRRAKAWAQTPEDQARCAIGLAQVALARTSRRQALAELADVAPHRSDTWALSELLGAKISLDLGDLAAASTRLDHVVSHPSASPTLLTLPKLLRARLLQAQGDSPGALGLMQQAMAAAASGPSEALLASVALAFAHLLEAQGKFLPASAMAERALALCPREGALGLLRARALLGAGSLLRRLGRVGRAREYLEEALERFQAGGLRRLEAQTLSALGLLFHLEQEFERAEELYGTSLGLGQVDSTSWGAQRDSLKADYGLLQLEAGSLNAAQDLIEQTAHLSHLRPGDASLKLQVLLGVLSYKNGQFDLAHHGFEQLKASSLLAEQTPEVRHTTHLLLDAFDALVQRARSPQQEAGAWPPQGGVIAQAMAWDPDQAKQDWLRLLHRLLQREVQAADGGHQVPVELRMDREARWFELEGEGRVDMSRRGPMRTILLTLARAHHQTPGVPVHAVDLFVAGWPDHHGTIPESGLHRLYSTLNRMRKLGLEGVLMTELEGYVLDPRVSLTFV